MTRTKGVQSGVVYPGIIFLMATIPFLSGLGNDFVAEDFVLLKIFSQDFGYMWNYAINASRMRAVYFPIGWLAFRVFNENVYGLHLLSVLGHAINCVLLYVFVSRLFDKKEIGFTAALIFSVYPRNHQPVLWIASYHVLLLTIFSLAALNLFLQYLQSQKSSWLVLSFFSTLLAVMTYEIGIILLVLLPLLEVVYKKVRLRDVFRFEFLKKYIPFFILFVLYGWVTFGGNRLYKLFPSLVSQSFQLEGMKVEAYQFAGIGFDTLRELLVYLTYAYVPQIPLRSLSIDVSNVVLAAVLHILVFVTFLKGGRFIRFAILWGILGLLPIVLFVPFGIADRYFYFSGLAISIYFAALGWEVQRRLNKKQINLKGILLPAVFSLYLILSVVLIQERVHEWRTAGQRVGDIVGDVIESYPAPESNDEFVIVGVPEYYQQVYFGNFIHDALEYSYQNKNFSVDTYSTRDPVIEAILSESTEKFMISRGTYLFLCDQGKIIDKTNQVSEEDLEKILEFVYQNS